MGKSRFLFLIGVIALVGCTVNGYLQNPFSHYTLIWEHPINVDTENVQEIEVPFVKHGNTFSLCFDKMTGDREYIQDDDVYLKNDKIEASFAFGDKIFYYKGEFLHHFDNHCPINGQNLILFFFAGIY